MLFTNPNQNSTLTITLTLTLKGARKITSMYPYSFGCWCDTSSVVPIGHKMHSEWLAAGEALESNHAKSITFKTPNP
jgi:hypothetical protein